MKGALGLIVACFAIALTANAESEAPIVVGIGTYPPPTWPPAEPHSDPAYALVNQPVIAQQQNGSWTCLLCQSIPEKINDADDQGLWTLSLTLTGKWGDQAPITAADLKAGLTFQRTNTSSQTEQELLSRLVSIEPQADRTISIRATGSYELALLALSHLYPLRSTNPIELKTQKKSVKKPWALMQKHKDHPGFYNGPYRYLKDTSPRSWELVPLVPKQKNHTLANIEVRYYRNPDSLAMRFEEGSVDFIPAQGLPKRQTQILLSRLHAKNRDDFLSRPGQYFEHLDLNLRNPVFIDRNVRRALKLSVDYKAIGKLLGRHTATPHGFPWLEPKPSTREGWTASNLKEAGELLTRAGWTLDDQGQRRRDDKLLAIPLTYPANDPLREKLAEALAGMWRNLGVDVTLTGIEPQTFFTQELGKTRFRGVALYSWKLLPFVVPVASFHSQEIPLAQNEYAGQNISGWQSRPVDRVLENWNLGDSEDFTEHAQTFLKLYQDDIPQIPLFLWNDIAFVQPSLEGVAFTTRTGPATQSASLWQKIPNRQSRQKGTL